MIGHAGVELEDARQHLVDGTVVHSADTWATV